MSTVKKRKLKFRVLTLIFFVALAVGGNAVYNAVFVTPDTKLTAARLDAPNAPAPITGPAADKAKAVALTKFPNATVDRVQQLSDGTYAVHLSDANGPHHVFENKAFKITSVA